MPAESEKEELRFSFRAPTEVFFGAGELARAGELLSERLDRAGSGRRSVLVVTDSKLVQLGLPQELIDSLTGYDVTVYDGVEPNPVVAQVNEAAAIAQEMKASAVFGIGGGSSLDTAKAAAALAASGESEIQTYIFEKKALPARGPLLAAVPTTAGTGSEVTAISVLTDPARDVKIPLVDAALFPDFAIVDPALQLGLPPALTASTGLDALSHALEALWSTGANPASDALALSAAQRILKNLHRAFTNGADINARTGMSLASTLAGMAFGQTKTAGVHAVSFPLTHRHGVPHGTACAMTLAPFARLNSAVASVAKKLDSLAGSVGLGNAADIAPCIAGLAGKVGVPAALSEFGISRDDWSRIIEEALKHPNMGNNPVPVDERVLREMFERMEGKG